MAVKQNQSGLMAPDGSTYAVLTDGAGNLAGVSANGYPPGAVAVTSSSGNVAAATATSTLAGVAGKTTYIVGIVVTGGGATTGAIVNGTVTGTIGGTMTFNVPVATGATVGNQPLYFDFYPAVPASAVNTPIVVSIPSLGSGNTNSSVVAWGYQI